MSKTFLAGAAVLIVAMFAVICAAVSFEFITPSSAQYLGIILSMATLGIVVGDKDPAKMTSLEDLQELRNELVGSMKTLFDKFQERGKKFEGEEAGQWETQNKGLNAIDARMKELRDSDAIGQRWAEIQESEERNLRDQQQHVDINDPDSGRIKAITPEDRQRAMVSWFRHKMDLELTNEQRESCKKLKFNPRASRLDTGSPIGTAQIKAAQRAIAGIHKSLHAQAIHRAMSAGTATEGKEFIPQGFMALLEQALFLHANIRNVVDIWRTDSGNEVPWPTASDQHEGEWIGESTAVTDADPSTGTILFGAHKVSSKQIVIPTELLEDSAFELVQFLVDIISRRIGRSVNRSGTTGDGNGQMTGLVTSAAQGHTATAGLAYSDMVRLEHSVDPLDRANGSYMFHDNILLALRLLTDADGRPLWTPGLAAGVADRINNRTYEINQYMDSTFVAGQKPVLFGDYKKYKLREVRGIRLYRLSELHRLKDQEGFVAFQRFDGKLINAGTDPLKYIEMV